MNWNRSDFLWILDRLLWVLFFEGERGERGKGFMVLFELGKMMVNDSWWHWILHGTKKKNYFEHFCIIKGSSCIFFFLFYSFLILNGIHGSQLEQREFVVFRVLKEFHLYRMYNTIDAKCHVELWIDWRVYSSASDQSTSSFYFLFIWSILQSLCRDIYYVCIYIYIITILCIGNWIQYNICLIKFSFSFSNRWEFRFNQIRQISILQFPLQLYHFSCIYFFIHQIDVRSKYLI